MKTARVYKIDNTAVGIMFMWLICPYCGASIRIDHMRAEQAHLCPVCHRVFVECLNKDRILFFRP